MAILCYFGGTLGRIPALTVPSGLIEPSSVSFCVLVCDFDNWLGGDTENGMAVAKITLQMIDLRCCWTLKRP